jgi:RluA family pseudouridine synthase
MSSEALTVLYADASILMIAKPAGVLSVPDGYDHSVPYLRRMLEPSYGRLWIVHRLDKETSGVMVLARNAAAHSILNTQFAEHRVSKTYHAIISGEPDWDEKRIEMPLRINVGRRNRTTVDLVNGKPSLTHFRVLERFPGFALLEARPETGRTHQIRAHLYDLGFSILSDPLYGVGERSLLINRLALHARALSIWHPKTDSLQVYEAPYFQDFNESLALLRRMFET